MVALASGLAAFNLVCTVTATFFDHKQQPDLGGLTLEYRINLSAGRYCGGACKETLPIANTTSTDIYLAEDRDKDGQSQLFIKISRESGAYLHVIGDSPGEIRWIGSCEKRPFSGFPKLKF